MKVVFAASFLRFIKKLDPATKEAVKRAVAKTIDLYKSGQRTEGLGIKRLRGDLWEARAGIRIRVVYSLGKDEVRFLLAGSHQDVKNFLRRA